MLMIHKKKVCLLVVIITSLLVVSCEDIKRIALSISDFGDISKIGSSQDMDSEEIDQVTAEEEKYEELQNQLHDLKSDIEIHHVLYKKSQNNRRSVLDDREALEASKEILALSNRLYNLANKSLQNRELIRQVSGSEATIRDYKKYAERMIDQFE